MRARVMVVLMLSCISATAQDEWANALVAGLGEAGSTKRASLDSIDFQFAMSVNEQAGFFDVKNKGEGGARLLYGMRERKDKSVSEHARDTLDFAINLYNLRM